jgi:CBS-domain-containing membrane protein
MQAATKPFLTLTAADLMSAPVMTIPQETSLREAARLLSRSSISGAPVVDQGGRCVGVLSSSDFVTWAGKGGEAGKEGRAISFIAPWGELINIEDSPDDEIRHYMTARPVTVAPLTPIGELAQKMVDAHIHRVLVVVDHNGPCGIVTSTDVLAAVARTARRAPQAGESPNPRARPRRRPGPPPPGPGGQAP